MAYGAHSDRSQAVTPPKSNEVAESMLKPAKKQSKKG